MTQVMAELLGRENGLMHGKGGSMHIFDPRVGFLGGHGIVGGQIPLAAGVAFAAKYLNQSRATLCFFGEAAVNIGSFHESLNPAQLWKLPVVFICENNGFGMGTPIEKASAIRDLFEKASSYDMSKVAVDGMDVLAVESEAHAALEQMRLDGAPVLREPAGERTLTAGDLVAFPSGHAGAHTLRGPGRFVIFDTVTGRTLLIPQGSRLIGTYDSVVAFGQSRALVVWQRIIMPNGTSVEIDNWPATDSQGYAGLSDQVDYHTWTLLKGVALSTLLGVTTKLSVGNNNGDLLTALRQSAEDSVNHVGQQITQKNLNVQPTMTVRPGWPLNVIVSKDLVLRPYKGQS